MEPRDATQVAARGRRAKTEHGGGGREIPGPFAATFQPRIPEELPVPAPSVPARPSPPPQGDSRPFQLPRTR